jgi:hypothetical protein
MWDDTKALFSKLAGCNLSPGRKKKDKKPVNRFTTHVNWTPPPGPRFTSWASAEHGVPTL